MLRPGRPDHWDIAGNAAIRQTLSLDKGADGGRCARIECNRFSGDGPDYHVMLCQVRHVSVRQGQWYRLAFRAKGEGISAGAVDVALTDTSVWRNAGLEQVFTPQKQWQAFELLFRATLDLSAQNSRLQIWFKGTGTLWMDDVVLTETAGGQQWYPQIATAGVKNWLPNGSFECGAANWGSFTHGLKGWAGGLYRLEGSLDSGNAQHGESSLRITVSPKTQPVFYFDYYDPVRQPVRRVLAANQGWFRVTPGESYTLSAYLRADRDGVQAELATVGAPDRVAQKRVKAGKSWSRQQFTFKPSQEFIFIAVGIDLENSPIEEASLWVDAVQLEKGEGASIYEPRRAVEAFIESAAEGNIVTNESQRLELTLRAFNNSNRKQAINGRLEVTDFFDKSVAVDQHHSIDANGHLRAPLPSLFERQLGFFRAKWSFLSETQALRAAVIQPAGPPLADSPLGFNHAYPWDFLVQRAQLAGVVWWRDWSVKWETVEPKKGQYDFAVPDAQIERVLNLGGQVEVLLPFPSALWSSTAGTHEAEISKAAGQNAYLRSRLPVAFAPTNNSDFGTYAAAVSRHYAKMPRPVTHVQILNEPVYTDYALPRQFGYSVSDYIRLLDMASSALHQTYPACKVVGGLSAGLRSGSTTEFINKGGLRSLDVFDLHMYDPARPAETFDAGFAALEDLMEANGGRKPVWITEWGCYADDDPACVPVSVGDATMNRCRWGDERSAAEHIVKFTAAAFGHGVRKIFFHAGTCGVINGPDAGGVLFEYGGTPRKMYPAVAALTRTLGVPRSCLTNICSAEFAAYVFTTERQSVAIAWGTGQNPMRFRIPPTIEVRDVMGNKLKQSDIEVANSPVYMLAANRTELLQVFKKP